MKIEDLEIRFSAIGVKKGFVTPTQVVKAMSVQVAEELKSGKYRPIDLILLDQKLITTAQIEEVRRCIEENGREKCVL